MMNYMKRFIRRYLPFIFIFFLIAIGVAGSYFYKNNTSYKNPDLIVDTAVRMLVEEVGRLIVLPTDEVPTVATVSDPKALKDKVFFAEAKTGDKVLIYTNAKKAILYDPVLKKIINVAPVNTGTSQSKLQFIPTGSTSSSNETQF